MKQLADQAIILSRIDFGEANRILTLLTAHHGKLSVMAKGVRKPKSKLAGGVELFTLADVVFIEAKSDIKTLASARLHINYSHISTDISRSMMAYDILKYTNKYTENVCEDSYFELVQEVFEVLNDPTSHTAVTWVWFGLRLLEISGHGINTTHDAHGAALRPDDSFNFDYESMSFLSSGQGAYTKDHIKVLRLCQRSNLAPLIKIGGVRDPAKDLQILITECIKYNT